MRSLPGGDLAIICGFGLVVWGSYDLATWLGRIVAGVVLIAAAFLLAGDAS